MKTSTHMADVPKSSLLQQLRAQSDTLRAQDQAARRPMEEALKEIDRCLWRAFRWLDEAVGHLQVIHPQVGHVFHVGNVLAIERPRFERGFVTFRRRALAGLEVLEHVEFFYRLEGAKALTLRVPPASAAGLEASLRTSTLPYQYQTEQDERRVVRYGLFHVQPVISASVRLEPDYHHQLLAVTLRNVDRFESVALEFAPDRLNEAALEDMLKFVLGESNGFLRRAPLALIRTRRDDTPPLAKPGPALRMS